MNEIVVSEQASQYLPIMPMAVAVQRRDAIVQFAKQILVKDTDFGVIPGTGAKPSLLKPGAEKLCSFFGLAPVFVPVQTVEDWTGAEHGGEAFFLYRYRCELYRNGMMVGSGIGSCNSWESKYRYRKADRLCPKCGQPAIATSKEEYGGGFYCNSRKGGCGAKYLKGAPEIVNQMLGKIANPDPADVVNTVDKMAQKRALVAATLIAVNASEFFTQDIEDMATGEYIDATYTVAQPAPEPAAPAPEHNGNGASPAVTAQKGFHAVGVKVFGKEWDAARPWLLRRYTTKNTSENVREHTSDMSVKELETLRSLMDKSADYLMSEWQKAQQPPIDQPATIDMEAVEAMAA